MNGADKQHSSGIFRIIFWVRIFSLGGSEALFIHDILRLVALFRNFLSFQCQGKGNLSAYFLFKSQELRYVINFEPFRKHGLCDLIHNIPNFPSEPKKVVRTSNPCQNVLTHDAGLAGQWPNYEGVCFVLCSLSPWVLV